ncbi:MAG: hypothetical protein CMF62_03590 [Magnetococcales bacterium]|nr:hypothetical protein [Magnetococcales bacterium]
MKGSYELDRMTVLDLYLGRLGTSKTVLAISHYQRKDIFDEDFMTYLIDSLVNGIPIRDIILHFLKKENDKDIYALVDGRQRTSAIVKILENPFERKYFKDKLKVIEDSIKPEDKIIMKKILRKFKKHIDKYSIMDISKINHNIIINKLKNSLDTTERKLWLEDTLKNLVSDLNSTFNNILKREVPVYKIDVDDEFILETFNRINSKGQQLDKIDLISSSWSKYDFIKSSKKKINQIMLQSKQNIIGDIGAIYIDSHEEKNTFSIYYYLRSFESYLCELSKIYKTLRPRTESGKFDFITNLFLILVDTKNIDNLPKILVEKYHNKSLKKIESKIMILMRDFNDKFFTYHKFCTVGGTSPITLNNLLEFIKSNKNKEMIKDDNFVDKFIFVTAINKIIPKLLTIEKEFSWYSVKNKLEKYLLEELETNKTNPTIKTKCLLFLINYGDKDINNKEIKCIIPNSIYKKNNHMTYCYNIFNTIIVNKDFT